jgi:hypothetical protein
LRISAFIVLQACATLFLLGARLEAVVISEIHYHPPPGEEMLEFVELTNDSATPEDISGYAFIEGISFVIPAGTVLEGYGILVICADVEALKARYGIENAIGNFSGRLDNSGERLALANHAGIAVQSLRYRERGKWPAAPGGTGHTLSLRGLHLDPKEPESWAQSRELGGTPGRPNFPKPEEEIHERVLIDRGELWRYAKGTAPFSSPPDAWLAPGFDDSRWLIGESGFGFGDDDDATVLDDMLGNYGSLAVRKSFTLSADDLAGPGELFLGMDFDDGFCAYLNGREIARVNCPGSPGQVPAHNALATASREAGFEMLFPIPAGILAAGENVLAIAGFNLSLNSSDFSLIPRLLHRVRGASGPLVVDETVVARGEDWRFRKGTSPFSTPASAWRQPGFADAGWASAPSGFGFREVGAEVVAYVVPAGTVGNQAFSGPLGMDFEVARDIVILRLGVFDSAADGLNLPITARLYDRSSRAQLASLQFTPASPGELEGGSRFKELASPLVLRAGFSGTMVAEGYGSAELNGNQGSAPFGLLTADGEGAIGFSGGGRFGNSAGQFPDTVDGGPVNRYAAGTFEFLPAGSQGGSTIAPPGVLTLLDDMPGRYTSIACRKRFQLTREQLETAGDFYLGVDYDDGFCAFLNGVEVARANCAAVEPSFADVASAVRELSGEELFPLPRELFVEGENLLAIAAYNAAAENCDFHLVPRLFRRRVLNTGAAAASVVFNELLRAARPGGGWVELHNAGAAPADLSGYRIRSRPGDPAGYLLPQGTTIAAGGFLVVGEAESGLLLSEPEVRLYLLTADGLAVTASTFDRGPPPGMAPGSFSECRFPDGGPLDWITLTPTLGAPNQAARIEDVVISEIFYHPPEGRAGEFLELYNRWTAAADLSGASFTSGIDYTFPEGTILRAGEYLVIAKEPEHILAHYGVQALGPYGGVLSNKGEAIALADRLGNPINRVRYHDGGRWSHWADGGGSSLELIDPRQDNTFASAWEASDESDKAAWEEHTFHVPAYVPAAESELNLYLVERGACVIDDVAVRRGGGANHIPNPGFETSTAGWIIGGTHIRSRRITEGCRTGSGCLELEASGKGDTLVNRIEIETSPRLSAGPYDVSLWARWLRGGSVLIVHGEYHAGPYRVTPCITCGVAEPNLSGNSMAQAVRLSVPWNLGTPGTENSATRRLRAATGTANLGPVIDGVEHSPPLPEAGEAATVTARVSDSDGVASVRAFYRTGSAQGAFDALPLFDDGLHGDGAAGDGVYGGQLPGFASGTRVVFYVEAADTLGAVRRFPVEAPQRTCLYLAGRPPAARLDTYSLILDTARSAELQSRQLHSNDLVDGAFVFENEKVYYNVGTRYRGSPWGRPSRASYRIRFPEDDRFHRGLRDMNLSKTGGGPNEGSALFLIGRNALPGRPSPVADYLYVDAWLNGGSLGRKAMIQSIDGDFLEKWYGEEALGPLLKANGRFVFTDGGSLIGQAGWEGASLIHRGENPENYRGYYHHSVRQSAEDWAPLLALTRALDRAATPDPLYDEVAEGIIDLDGFSRVLSARMLLGDGDAFAVNNGHNGYLAYDSIRGLWGLLAFDAEAAFGNGGQNLLSSLDPGVTRFLSHPRSRRAYFRVLSQYAEGYWSAATAGPFLDALQRATGYGTGGIKSFITSGAARIRSTIQSAQGVAFRIVTNAGNDFETEAAAVTLEGEASIDVESILYRLGAGDLELLRPSAWTTPVRWRARFELQARTNVIELLGFDASGSLAGSARIAVTRAGTLELAVERWFPTGGPASGGTEVIFEGSGFALGLEVFFGEAPAAVVVESPERARAVSPAAALPFPPGGKVDLLVRLGGSRVTLAGGFTYRRDGLFIRGDANQDSKVDISDAIALLSYLFLGGAAELGCEKSVDADDNGAINITDAIAILEYLFRGGAPLPAPYPSCGPDPSEDSLSCERTTCGS